MLLTGDKEIYLIDTMDVFSDDGNMLQNEFPEYSSKLDKLCVIQKKYNDRAK